MVIAVTVSWRLAFDFLLLADGGGNGDGGEAVPAASGEGWTVYDAPATLPVDTMQWELPITVMPTNPANVPANQTCQQVVF